MHHLSSYLKNPKTLWALKWQPYDLATCMEECKTPFKNRNPNPKHRKTMEEHCVCLKGTEYWGSSNNRKRHIPWLFCLFVFFFLLFGCRCQTVLNNFPCIAHINYINNSKTMFIWTYRDWIWCITKRKTNNTQIVVINWRKKLQDDSSSRPQPQQLGLCFMIIITLIIYLLKSYKNTSIHMVYNLYK